MLQHQQTFLLTCSLDFLVGAYSRVSRHLPNVSRFLPEPPPLYISGKWFNYFGLMIGVGFDWAYWFMTALPFRRKFKGIKA